MHGQVPLMPSACSRTVLMVSGNGPPVLDGVGHYTARLMAGLSKARPEWRWVWLRRNRRWFTAPLSFTNGTIALQPWHTWGRPGRWLAAAVARALRPDITHIQEQIHSFHETPAAAEILKVGRCRIATVHEIHPELKSCQWTGECIGLADRVLTCDRFTAEKCIRYYGRAPDCVLWSPSNLRPMANPIRQRGLVVTFGFLSAIKGMMQLYEALGKARERVPDLRWRIVGPFYPNHDPYHSTLATELRGDWIQFVGSCDDLDDPVLRRWLSEAAVMALPFVDGASARRGSLQSAWAFGLPVVTTPPPCPDDAVCPGENCLTVPLEDTDAWADVLVDVLSNTTTATRLAIGSRAAGEQFSWTHLVERHLELYDSLLCRADRR
jgi:glycosyltransferase involved in cell wall biosynthesis